MAGAALVGPPLEDVGDLEVEAVHAQVGGDAVGDLEPLAVAVGLVAEDVDEAGATTRPAASMLVVQPGRRHRLHRHPELRAQQLRRVVQDRRRGHDQPGHARPGLRGHRLHRAVDQAGSPATSAPTTARSGGSPCRRSPAARHHRLQLQQLADDCREQLAAGWISVDLETGVHAPGDDARSCGPSPDGKPEVGRAGVRARPLQRRRGAGTCDTLLDVIRCARRRRRPSTPGLDRRHLHDGHVLQTIEADLDEGLDVSASPAPPRLLGRLLPRFGPSFNSGWQDRLDYSDLVVAGTGEQLTAIPRPASDNLLVAAYGIEDDVVTCIKSRVMIGSAPSSSRQPAQPPKDTGCFGRC